LQANGNQLPWLSNSNFGNKMIKGNNVLRMAEPWLAYCPAKYLKLP
jgi:hypothetical protein